ncbi:transporter substrate-binding protein [Rhizobium phage RHph_I1_18]|nr:transporter substrate-binding protein [Rhizobium phage RHph_I1_18]
MAKRFYLGFAALAALYSMAPSPSSAAETIRLCTGKPGGVYDAVAQDLKAIAGATVNIEIVNTVGSIEEMQRLVDIDKADPTGCDAALLQGDAPTFLKRSSPAKAALLKPVGSSAHREYLWVLCNKESGIDDIKELSSSSKPVAIGAPGSGTWLIWQNFIAEDSFYADIPTSNDSGQLALSAVSGGDASCMLESGGVPNPTVSEADANYGDTVVLANATDKDFNDAVDLNGKPLYTFSDAPLLPYTVTFGHYWSDVETVSQNAGFYINKQRVSPAALDAFIKAAARAATNAKANYGK